MNSYCILGIFFLRDLLITCTVDGYQAKAPLAASHQTPALKAGVIGHDLLRALALNKPKVILQSFSLIPVRRFKKNFDSFPLFHNDSA